MSPKLLKTVQEARDAILAMCRNPSDVIIRAKRDAITLTKWRAAEAAGFVRLREEWDQDFDPSNFPDCDWGEDPEAFGSIGEYRLDPESDEWEHADSVWGHVGYRDVLDWRENPYILDIMAETLDQFKAARKRTVLGPPVPSY